MRSTRILLIFSLLLAVLSACVLAQGNNDGDKNTATKTTGPNTLDTKNTNTNTNKPQATNSRPAAPSPAADRTKTDTKATESTTSAASIASAIDKSNNSPTLVLPSVNSVSPSATEIISVPTDDSGRPLPTLPGGFQIPTVITPPPTKNAPFMQQSRYPEGTVFIAVGAALAFFGFVVVAWRGLVAWSLHRSVKRAAAMPKAVDPKTLFRTPRASDRKSGFYAAGPGSTLSLDHLSTTVRTPGTTNRAHTPNSSLFFSPTSNTTASERRSAYLPAGFYAAGASSNGAPAPPVQGSRKSMTPGDPSLTNLQQSYHPMPSGRAGYPQRGTGISPPSSPLMPPQSRGNISGTGTERLSGLRINDSQTSLSFPPAGRAPSAYLEDLFESHQTPQLGKFT